MKPRNQHLQEQAQLAGLQPDTERGIIPGVKVLGLSSFNGHRYRPEAMKKALAQFEGVKVFWNHVKDRRLRLAEDFFGRIVNVRLETDGLRGDLKYLKNHPKTAYFLEAVQEAADHGTGNGTPFTGSLGLSPSMVTGLFRTNADGSKEVDHIEQVESVDIVAFPGTTLTLQESYHMETWLKLCESLKTEKARAPFQKLCEEMGLDMAAPAEASADAPGLAWIEQLLASGTPEDKAKAKKVFKMLLAGGAGDDSETEAPPADKTQESLQVKKLARQNQVLQECLDAGYKPSKERLAVLVGIKDTVERKKLIQESAQGGGKLPRGPRSQSPATGKSAKLKLKDEFAELESRVLS